MTYNTDNCKETPSSETDILVFVSNQGNGRLTLEICNGELEIATISVGYVEVRRSESGLRPVYVSSDGVRIGCDYFDADFEEELEIVKNGDVEIYYPREVQ